MVRRLSSDTVTETAARRPLRATLASGGETRADEAGEAIDTIAYRDGYAEGYAEGERDAVRDVERRMREQEERMQRQWQDAESALLAERGRLAGLAGGLDQALAQQAAAMEEQAFEIALAALREMFGVMHADRELLRRLCAQMVDELRARALRIAVAPQDRAFLPEQLAGLDVVAEADLAAGTCRLATPRGEVESSIGARLEAIYLTMREALEETRA